MNSNRCQICGAQEYIDLLHDFNKLKDRASMLETELSEERLVTKHVQEESETFERWYEQALTYVGLPTTPEEARKKIEELEEQ